MKKILYLALALAAMTSCQKNEEEAGNHPVAARFTDAAITRATATAWEVGDAIGVYMVRKDAPLDDNNIIDRAKNIRYVLTDIATGTFIPVIALEQIYFPANGSAVDFYAYYPHQAAVAGGIYKIDVTDQRNPAAIDLMSSSALNMDKTYPTVPLSFGHRLSKLSLTLAPGTGFTTADLAGITVTVKGTPVKADYDIALGSFFAPVIGAPIAAKTTPDGTASEAILIPSPPTAEGSMQLIFTLADGTKLGWDIPADALASGEHYQYDLLITLPGVKLVSQNITKWTANARVDGGTADEVVTVLYAVGDYYPDQTDASTAIGIVCWLDGTAPDYVAASGSTPAKGPKGKIMSLDEGSGNWATAKLWVSAKTPPQGKTWSAASMPEYWEIYRTWNGKYEADVDATARTTLNRKLTDAAGTVISNTGYWAPELNQGYYQHFDFAQGRNISSYGESIERKVRAISPF